MAVFFRHHFSITNQISNSRLLHKSFLKFRYIQALNHAHISYKRASPPKLFKNPASYCEGAGFKPMFRRTCCLQFRCCCRLVLFILLSTVLFPHKFNKIPYLVSLHSVTTLIMLQRYLFEKINNLSSFIPLSCSACFLLDIIYEQHPSVN